MHVAATHPLPRILVPTRSEQQLRLGGLSFKSKPVTSNCWTQKIANTADSKTFKSASIRIKAGAFCCADALLHTHPLSLSCDFALSFTMFYADTQHTATEHRPLSSHSGHRASEAALSRMQHAAQRRRHLACACHTASAYPAPSFLRVLAQFQHRCGEQRASSAALRKCSFDFDRSRAQEPVADILVAPQI